MKALTERGDTFCVYPFSHLNVTMEGKATLCCRAGAHLDSHGRPLSLHTESFAQIWNSEHMQSVRRDMLEGRPVPACEHCYRMEESGGTSLRQIAHQNSERLVGVPPHEAFEATRLAVSRRGLEAPPPTSLHLWLGNLCNLKCRMCSSGFSSQIAADPVHSKWNGVLTRYLVLLPDLVTGVAYSGFGELGTDAAGESREAFLSRGAIIVLPGNGDPITELDLSGNKSSEAPIRLRIEVGDQLIAEEWLGGTEWSLAIRPALPVAVDSPIRLGLSVADPEQKIRIRSMRIACRGAMSKAYPEELVSRFPSHLSWAENRDVLLGELLAHPDRLRHINFAGGEPMLNPHLPAILSMLVDSGHAGRISLFFSTNATVFAPEIVELLERFENVGLAFSLDGVGALQEYIRPPAKWETLWRNVLRYSGGTFQTWVHTTPQAYNIFGLLDLVRLASRHDLSVGLNNVLYEPRWLSLDMLPEPIVQRALDEWLEYRDKECRPDSFSEVDTVIGYLRRPRAKNIAELQESFVRFTNELDRSRGQSLAIANPVLYDALVENGFDFRA